MFNLKMLFRAFATGRTTGWLTILLIGGLFPVSLVYRLVVSVRNHLFNFGLFPVTESGIFVVSVGNIAAGGTGKTPVTDYIVKYLTKKGCKVGIVSRGYGGDFNGRAALVSDGRSMLLDVKQSGDEPLLLARRNPTVPVAIAPRRIDGIKLLTERCQVDCVVLDDAFQHRAVARNLDIVLLDGRRPTGNGHLLPAGILREPLQSIKRANLAILTRCDAGFCNQITLPVSTLKCRHELAGEANLLGGGILTFDKMQNKKVFAFAGIAEPEAFFSALRDAGVELSGTFAFPDHVDYSPSRLATLVSAAGKADILLTTEKDAVKLDPERLPLPCYSIGVQPVFDNEKTLLKLLDEMITR